ncbi:hydantoinase B/oxoprolinase family protein [Caenimonas sedimenti]|uniref:hydantoinase B/oxoprolinase family protein n=1 Tax=Caenimonas sedimenti TaxID=2596921 RepID=UPI001648F94A|nr:hydantoinase B/oxoprolinase family protein [Caenimonas sedimenti]
MKRVALVCTRGFADVLTLARQNRADPYALHVPASPWLAALPPERRFEVGGRIDAHGAEVEPLDAKGLVAALKALPEPPEAIAVSLLFASRNPLHEKQVRELLVATLPHVPVHCSHEAEGPGGEYERTLAAVAAAGLDVAALVPPQQAAPGDQDSFPAQMEAIADAMQNVIAEKAFSTIVREAMDCATAIFLPDGRMVAQARTLPLLLGSLSPAVQGILAECPVNAMVPGDGYLSNDPWRGGTHLPDFILLRPVFEGGRVQALVACILHHQDVGGITPGSLPANATSVHQEGLRIPPVQLYRAGQTDPSLLRLLCTNSRTPDHLAGDLRAQWAALLHGDAALQPLLAGKVGFTAQCEAALHASEAATRAALAAAPDGDYRFVDALDGDGISHEPVRIDVVLRKRGDTLEVDLRGCAPQTRGPANASRASVWAAVSYLARMLAPQAASNDGCTAPITLKTAPGTIVNPGFPAALNARTNLVKLLANALMGAWAQALPDYMPAANAGVSVVLSLSGQRAEGTEWLFTEIIASASGGAPWGPGGSGVSTDVGNARNTPAETIEGIAPLRVERIAVRRGSGGAGEHRGGDGVVRCYRLLEGSGMISYRGERHRSVAQGATGAAAGAPGSARIERADGTVVPLPAKAQAQWHAGDRLVIETAGAGGWGLPGSAGPEIA